MRHTVLLTALLLATLLTTPAHARYDYAGLTCGLATSNDITSLIVFPQSTQSGVVTGGPWTVVNESSATGAGAMTITCTVQFNDWNFDAFPSVSRSSTTVGNAGVLVDTIQYMVAPDTEVYLCTTITWTGVKGTEVVRYDAESFVPGDQCARANRIVLGNELAYTRAPRPLARV